jgi:hypothetical protein
MLLLSLLLQAVQGELQIAWDNTESLREQVRALKTSAQVIYCSALCFRCNMFNANDGCFCVMCLVEVCGDGVMLLCFMFVLMCGVSKPFGNA